MGISYSLSLTSEDITPLFNMKCLTLTAVILLIAVQTGNSLKCYQCTTTKDKEKCEAEKLEDSKACPIKTQDMCMLTRMETKDGDITYVRGCASSEALGVEKTSSECHECESFGGVMTTSCI